MTPASGVRRWPVHPPPSPGEALTSWLARLAALYGMPAGQMLRHNLGEASALLDDPRAADLDFDPPAAILEALAERTGTELGELRMTTIAGWVPWLADTLDPCDGQEAFDTYVRQDSVLLTPGEAGRSTVPHWLPWIQVRDQEWRTTRRACPACTAAPDRGTSLLAALPLMTTCGEHGCRLEPEISLLLDAADRDPMPARPVPAPMAATDQLTWEGMTTGTVKLPRRTVHIGVWLRMLRTLLDEVSLPGSRVRQRSAAALSQIWDAAGSPPRAGLKVWRPYEALGAPRQESMLEAASCALDLIQAGKITAYGTLGHLLTREPRQHVYEGDRPSPAEEARDIPGRSWEQARQDVERWFQAARTDPAVARQILGTLTHYSRAKEAFDRERDFMIGYGIPARSCWNGQPEPPASSPAPLSARGSSWSWPRAR